MSKHRKPTYRAKRLTTIGAALALGFGTFAAFPASAAASNFTLASTDNFDNLNGWTVYDDRPKCDVSGGILTLHGNPDGSTCGMAENHNQTYGRYEVRAKFPAPSSHQFDTTFILWPQDDAVWKDAEIDYIEKTDPSSKSTYAFVHSSKLGGGQKQFTRKVDMTQWHTYGVEWTPGKLVGTVDGTPWWTVTGPAVSSVAHHQTLQMDLNREAGPIVPTTVQVDWFKRYAYTPGAVTKPAPPTKPSGDVPVITTPKGFTVSGAIGTRWRQTPNLGNPTSNALSIPGGSKQNFEHGRIYWSQAHGAHALRGSILARYDAIGASASSISFPRSEEVTTSYGSYVNFARGAITWNRSTGRVTVLPWKA